jgi:CubicO group peptidase (beta-lactamase class C family)
MKLATRLSICLALVATSAARAAPALAYDLDAVTLLSRGMLSGVGVQDPVPGFELRLLKNGSPIYHQAFGLWSIDRPANVDSSTKTVSAATLMSVIESSGGSFSLDSKLSSFLPSFDTLAKRNITIRQAFSHSSGLPGSESGDALTDPTITLQQSAAMIAQLPMVNLPSGSKFSYGGVSMQAAGAAAEVAAGGTGFAQLVRDRITTPLGMTNTRFVLASQSNPRVAGGIESTATDFSRFMEALRNGGVLNGVRVLAPASVQTMFTRQTANDITLVNSPFPGATDFASTDYGVGTWILRRAGSGGPGDAVQVPLAAGARGFHAWVDLPFGYTGVIATELSRSSNIIPVTNQIIDALRSIAQSGPRLAGDANRDNAVNFDDLLLLAANYNGTGKLWSQGDFTADGRCNFDDLLLLASNYNMSLGASPMTMSLTSAVPEPTMLASIGIASVVLGRRAAQRRR